MRKYVRYSDIFEMMYIQGELCLMVKLPPSQRNN